MKDNMTDTAPDEKLDITAPENALPPLALEDLPETMREACSRASWTRLMPVQAHALPYLMAGRDIMSSPARAAARPGATCFPCSIALTPGTGRAGADSRSHARTGRAGGT